MSDGYLSIAHGHIHLAGKLVPGNLVRLEIGGEIRFDEAEVDNHSGKKKTPLGWEDCFINIEMVLLSDEKSDCYEKLSELNGIFKGLDNNANPKVYGLVNAHAVARGVDQVVFKGLRSSETNEDDVIQVSLAFDEHNPPTIPPEKGASMANTSNTAPDIDQTDPDVDPSVTADDTNPFNAGSQAGVS